MTSTLALTLDPVDPAVRTAARDLAEQFNDDSEVAQAIRLILTDVAEGSRVVVLRSDDEVTPAQAADMIGVSRQFVDRLCADGVLAYRRLPGSKHRRIRVQDVTEVSAERDSRRAGAEALRTAIAGLHD